MSLWSPVRDDVYFHQLNSGYARVSESLFGHGNRRTAEKSQIVERKTAMISLSLKTSFPYGLLSTKGIRTPTVEYMPIQGPRPLVVGVAVEAA